MPGMGEDEISAANLKYAEPLIPYFGEPTIKKCFAKKWQEREEAFSDIQEQVQSKNDAGMFQAGLNASSLALNDKIQQINQKGLSMLSSILKQADGEAGSAGN